MNFSKKSLSLGLAISIGVMYIPTSNALGSIGKIQGVDIYEAAALIVDKQNYSTAILVNSDKILADGLNAS
jgi:hypothetical protein